MSAVAAPARVQPPTLETIASGIAANVGVARARTRARIMAVVKADGYGHGAVAVAHAAVAAGAAWLGTTSMTDALQLRRAGITVPILTWLHADGMDGSAAAAERIDVAVGSVEALEALLAHRARGLRVHLHLDTGMAREGCAEPAWAELLLRAQRAQAGGRLRVTGLMGHLAKADRAEPAANAAAVQRMRRARLELLEAGLGDPITHLAATAAALSDPATHFDMVRFGAGLVGIDPSGTTALHGASRLTAPIVHSALVAADTPVGYGGSTVTRTATHLSVVPLGYADGIPRTLHAAASVEVRGLRCPIVGRVSMDQIVIDTGGERMPLGTLATVFGPDDPAPSIHEWADWAGTIPHTVVTGIGPRVRRTTA
ncbi:alanine racemase [Agrococcus sp. ARC_14]|uniref:alanine racemase n=1 Tax=Agrococcus sp. ARC_14 TaxID=2919927 RepID=UPI001F0514E2|nr:alanine racemase [Agrococcus sp. ARC_14]